MSGPDRHSSPFLIPCLAAAGAIALSLFVAAPSSAAEGVPTLLREGRSLELELDEIPMTDRSFRARLMRIDRGAIRRAARDAGPLDLELFDDLHVRAEFTASRKLSRGGLLWTGTPERDPNGSVVLLNRRGSITGSVRIDDRVYMIRPWAGGAHVVEEINMDLFPSEANDFEIAPQWSDAAGAHHRSAPPAALDVEGVEAADDEIRELTVLVVFTGGARKEAGGRQALVSLVELGVEETNLALERSNVNARFELVGVKKVPFKATSDSSDDLFKLRVHGDGVLDKATNLREKFDADFVQLITDDADPAICGRAYVVDVLGPNAAEFAFGLTQVRCISPNYTFGHELGHNMGLAHQKGSAGVTGQFKHSFGYCEPSLSFRTMLAVSGTCSTRRVLNFSSPRSRVDGLPTGVKGQADNARSILKVLDELVVFRGGAGAPDAPAATGEPDVARSDEGTPAEETPGAPAAPRQRPVKLDPVLDPR